ncbi:unnamed protein product [Mucor fragilis]
MVDWVDLSNTTKRYKAFSVVEKHQNDLLINEANQHVIQAATHQQLEDPFVKESAFISPLLLAEKIKTWRSTATRIDKLYLQDLLYYSILDFVSTSQSGTSQVLGEYFKAEKIRQNDQRVPNDIIKTTTRTILRLRGKGAHLPLKEVLVLAKERTDNSSKIIRKICKVYVNLEEEKIHLYNIEANEATYLMCLIRPIFVQLASEISSFKFLWYESCLRCKKAEQNALLIENDEKAATTTKIDGILINEDFNLEVALIEVSGPNNKVNATHFYEDRKKLAKNLKCMYKAIMLYKEQVSVVSKRDFKVYAFHFYLNKLYIYSLGQTAMGHYVLNLVSSSDVPHSKVVIHALPSFLANLWIVRDIFNDLNNSLVSLLTENEPSSQSSNESDHDHYISPTKKQKTSSSRVATS